CYLRASQGQRRGLLAGLLDTDGHCDPDGGVEFYSTVETLAGGALELGRSLGYPPTIRRDRAEFNGRDYGFVWTVSFTPSEKVFYVSRKASRQCVTTRTFSDHRYITSVVPVESVPVRCIAVDSPSHLFLAGEAMVPTHNSVLMGQIVAAAIFDPECSVYLLDFKGPVLFPWAMAAKRFADRDIDDVLSLLEEV